MSKHGFVRRLASHPKLLGVLFATCLLLGQAGSVAATNFVSPGP